MVKTNRKLNLNINAKQQQEIIIYQPTKYQLDFHKNNSRFRIVCAGVRVGKTFACIQEIVKFCMENPKSLCWWVAPTVEVTERGFDTFEAIFPTSSSVYQRYVKKTIRAKPKSIHFNNGSRIDFKSADAPRGLVGAGLNFLVIDEAAFIDDEVWFHYLRPRLTDKKGRAIIISTPERKNWFYTLYHRGLDPLQKEYSAFHWITEWNTHIPNVEEEIKQAKEDLSEEDFRNLYLASFLEEEGQVFKNIHNCIRKFTKVSLRPNCWYSEDQKEDGYLYSIGIDVALSGKDFTVIIVTKYIRNKDKMEKRVVYLERISEDSFLLQAQKIKDIWKRFGYPTIYCDATGIGVAVLEELNRPPGQIPAHLVKPIIFNNRNKHELIGRLKADMEHNRVSFPEIPVLIKELSIYERKYNAATGNVSYGAAGFQHDDCVIALALATIREKITQQRVFTKDVKRLLGF